MIQSDTTKQSLIAPLLLVVDDDKSVRILVEEGVKNHGIRVVHADSGEQALMLFDRLDPDIVVLDIQMNGIDGIETCRRIRALPNGCWVPILIMTGSDDVQSIESAYRAGASDFMFKPINWPILIHHINFILRAGQAIEERNFDLHAEKLINSLQPEACFDSVEDLAVHIAEILSSDSLITDNYESFAFYLNDRLAAKYALKPNVFPAVWDFFENLNISVSVDPFIRLPLGRVIAPLGSLVMVPKQRSERSAARRSRLQTALAERCTQLIDRVRTETELRLAYEVFEQSLNGVAIIGDDGFVIKVNRAFEKITGYSSDEIVGHNINILKSGEHDPRFYKSIWDNLHAYGIWQGEIWNRKKCGSLLPVWMNISTTLGSEGRISHFIAVLADISRFKEQEKKITALAYYDELTGLANRSLLNDHIELALAQSVRGSKSAALLFIDLDRFKSINETLGHAFGDSLLKEVADRLKKLFRNGDTFSRQGGDEFMALLTDLPMEQCEAEQSALAVAEKILVEISQPVHIDSHEFVLSASIGTALFPHHAKNQIDLVKFADVAMYAAKEKGRNACQLFMPDLARKEQKRFTMERKLRQALDNGEFVLYYQPQLLARPYTSGTGVLVGAECLIRWQSPELGMVPPLDFISIAEECGLIGPIGDEVLAMACRRLRLWEQNGRDDYCHLAVNISPKQLSKHDFVDRVKAIIADTGLNDVTKLELEVTESALLHNTADAIEKLKRIRGMGIRVAVDDFGTGYSSLSYLKNFPLDVLKIDQTFVRECLTDYKSRALVQAIIAMADGLGLETVAEGIESRRQMAFLDKLGCRVFQGYLFSKPVPVEEFEATVLTREWNFSEDVFDYEG